MSKRSYVTFYLNEIRYREYNAKKLHLEISPNNYKTYKERLKYLKLLAYEFTKALEKGWQPVLNISSPPKIITLKTALNTILDDKLKSDLSISYKRDLSTVIKQFELFTPIEELTDCVSKVNARNVEEFLNQFNISATYYMNKRRALNVFFSELKRTKQISDNPVQNSLKKKQKSTLHKIYSKKQLNEVLNFLKIEYPNLHLACLLAYGCFLRPHQEVRLLKFNHLNHDCSKITLAGNENKSKKIRTVNIPIYVQKELLDRKKKNKNTNHNIISNSNQNYNVSYLNTQWSRAKVKMIDLGILQQDQTIYSFRHTAAINVYQKTKDLHILQQLLQHSNMIVTLNYLRGLGEVNDERLKDVMPEL